MMSHDDLMQALTTPPRGRSRRFSSNEQPEWNDGNMDFSSLEPGQVLRVPLLEGPGMVTHIWMTTHAGLVEDLNCLSLRIWYDDRPDPGVEVPIGTFFAMGGGRLAPVSSAPVAVSESGSLTCYWRMPFARACRITVTNDHPTRMVGLYWQIDWLELPDLPPETLYFHARYRQEYPAVGGRDYLLFEGSGVGRYVGTVLEVTLAQDGWFGEGDDFFYIDGEETPSLQGTGTEDYFNDAWGLRRRSADWFGSPVAEGYSAGDSLVCYRWHVPDPVHFHRSLRVTLEHKGNAPESTDFWYLERPDFYSSTAFWYQLGTPAPFGDLPGYPERRPPWLVIPAITLLKASRVDDPRTLRVDMSGLFGMRPAACWSPTGAGCGWTLPFSLGRRLERCALRLSVHTGPTRGVVDLEVDGRPSARDVDLGAGTDGIRDVDLGVQSLEAGYHEITCRSKGTRDFSVDAIRLLPLPPPATLTTRRPALEGHFVRLAIGRAVYAFRQVEGRLPEHLAELVTARLLEDRFRRDENGLPLESRAQGGKLVVVAPGWRSAWEGIDTRR